MSTPVEQIKERLSIVDVISSYLKLERAGRSFKAKCPFHNEKTPSFFISPARNSFYCFGCNKGGDIFSFVQEFEGLDFVGALRVLAQRAGVELKRIDPKVRSHYARLYLVLEKATRFFEAELAKSKEARTYLLDRGLAAETVKNWRLGFAPHDWRQLHDHLLKEGFTPAEMGKVGLIKHKEAEFLSSSPPLQRGSAESARRGGGEGAANIRYYDTFRGRIMFPILDGASRVIAFSGRILPRLDDGKTGKYINSPETILYNKSRILYGFDKSKLAMRSRDAVILVEGQMDLLMVHQAGQNFAVAVSGTALTREHLALLKRLTNNLLLSFDADSAGQKASERAIRLALAEGFAVKVIALSGGKDPAELIAANLAAWEKAVSGAVHVIEFLTEGLLNSSLSGREQALAIEKNILPLIALLQSPVEQSHFLKFVGEKSGLREEALWQAFRKVQKTIIAPSAQSANPAAPAGSSAPAGATRADAILRKLWSLLFFAKERGKESGIDADAARARLRTILGDARFAEREIAFARDESVLLFEGEALALAATPAREIAELLGAVEEETLALSLSEALEQLSRAERGGKQEESAALLSRCKDLSDKLTALKSARLFR